MNQWFKDNWDKLLSVFVSVVLAGTVGYFSGIMAVQSDITNLRERIRAAETDLTTAKVNVASLTTINGNLTTNLQTANGDIKFLKQQNDISTQTNKLLDLRIEQQREKTLQELQKLIKVVTAKAADATSTTSPPNGK